MKKTGILGGTFNPIHYGHLMIAEHAYSQYGLDEIRIMPTGRSPHKDDRQILPAGYRIEMIEAAIADNPHLKLDRTEIESGEVNYTYLTLQRLSEKYQDTEFYFIMGADSLLAFSTWRNPDIISKYCTILAAVRDDADIPALEKAAAEYQKKYHTRTGLIQVPNFSISSQNIRERMKAGISVRYMLPDREIEYIQKKGLYQGS